MRQGFAGRTIRCDGEGCEAKTLMPVTLRRNKDKEEREAEKTAQGWLFVIRGDNPQSFCPKCAKRHYKDFFLD